MKQIIEPIRFVSVTTLADDQPVLRLSVDGSLHDVPLTIEKLEALAVYASRTLGYVAMRALYPDSDVEQIGASDDQQAPGDAGQGG